MPSGRWSRSRLINMLVKPNTALVTWPEAVAMSVGRAKKARYASEFPSSSRSFGKPPVLLRVQVAVDDLLADHLEGDPLAHGGGADPAEGLRLPHRVVVHEDAL